MIMQSKDTNNYLLLPNSTEKSVHAFVACDLLLKLPGQND